MAPNRSSTLQEKVLRLRRTYLAKLPQSLAEARHGCALLARDGSDERVLYDLQRTFHNTKGTAASLGLPEISAEGAIGAELVLQLQHLDPSTRKTALPQKLQELRACIARLEVLGRGTAEAKLSVSASPALTSATPETARKPRRRVVFLCDDDLDGDQVGAQLSRFGYLCTSFTDPEHLKSAVLDEPPDAVVISTAAIDMVAELRNRAPVPVLFVSNQGDFHARLKAVQAGGEAYFLKPVSAHEIMEFLDNVTSRNDPDPFRILVIDDDTEIADYHATILETAGMSTRRLEEPAKILEMLAEFQPDLLLMDMYMPTCSGHDLSRVIRQIPQFVSLPIIFLSSETDKTIQVSAMRLGADAFLTKPILPEDLVNAVIIRAERTRTLRTLMMRDSLTGLLNHTTMSQFLETSLALAQRHESRLCFVMLDLDHFKLVNDTYGHPAGDQVLVALARMLKQRLRSSDLAGRYGGEEFAVVLQDASVADAAEVIEQIRLDFAALTFTAGRQEFSCSFSGGIAGFPEVQTAHQIVHAADQALYSAKRRGRNRIATAQLGNRAREK